MKSVIILKSESESTEEYVEQLKKHKLNPVFVPTLGFAFRQLDVLKERLNDSEKYSGLILTSPRSVDAIREALGNAPIPEGWKKLHNYSVGEATHHLAMMNLNQLYTKGKETGTSGTLADYILENFEGDKKKPFLYPCGNMRTDTLLAKLLAVGFTFEPLTVYETVCHPDLDENLKNAMNTENVEYLAFFSPSGVDCTYEWFTKNNLSMEKKKLVAIGPSTRRAIQNKGLDVYKVAEKPTVECLIKVLIDPNACRPKYEPKDEE
ncbi:uroporphyrinogen-III synthase-like [Condylostylus longicornis]|uniref:uroporphyrinogen-III synthase-like n=1 Tax=Condylostylus longicornis TaxID=2530218 RepID=UPI00244DA066|nr:uroporphyrinogen-III synthase-like [Condylostylus longicornis]